MAAIWRGESGEVLTAGLHGSIFCKPWRRRRPGVTQALPVGHGPDHAPPALPRVLLNSATGWGVWLWLGPIVILGIVPLIDWSVGLDPSNPPDDVIKSLEQDRYYRWLTYLFLPLQYAGFAVAFWYIATADISTLDRVGLAITVGFIAASASTPLMNLAQEGERRALAVQDRARADLLRALLHRAQSRPPRARRDT